MDVRSAPPINCYCRQECPGKYQDVHTCMNQLISLYGSTLNQILGEKKSLCARKMLKEKQIIVSRRSDKGNNLRDRAGKQGMEGQFRSSASDAHHQPPSTPSPFPSSSPSLANYRTAIYRQETSQKYHDANECISVCLVTLLFGIFHCMASFCHAFCFT